MLTQLATVKSRLALDPLDPTYDALLTRAIVAISARFDQETNRSLGRIENVTFEFPAAQREILVPCYPIETVLGFETKSNETAGWIEQPGVEYLVRNKCILSLSSSLEDLQPLTDGIHPSVARVTYTGGYLLPEAVPVPAASPLPADLEQAATEQTAFWFQTRNEVGVVRQWPKGGAYEQFVDVDLLPGVRETLRRYTRFSL